MNKHLLITTTCDTEYLFIYFRAFITTSFH